jgi:TatD DNase family protein
MKIIDAHTHVYDHAFDGDRSEIIKSAKAAGIQAILLPNEDTGSIDAIHRLCEEEPDFAYPMIGLHPGSVTSDYAKELSAIERQISKRAYWAVGEIGMDLYWDKSRMREQKIVFEEQLRWSIDLGLPVSLHTRDAFPEVLEIIHRVGSDRLKGVFHCFGGTDDDWKAISGLPGFYIGIGGILTFKNSALKDVIRKIPLNRVVVETDAPYLAPVPFRGRRNEPAYILETIKSLAVCYQLPVEEVALNTFNNTLYLFNI